MIDTMRELNADELESVSGGGCTCRGGCPPIDPPKHCPSWVDAGGVTHVIWCH